MFLTHDEAPNKISTSETDASPTNSTVHMADENFHDDHASRIPSRKNTRVSMDFSSKEHILFEILIMSLVEKKHNSCQKFYPSFMKPKPQKQIIANVSGASGCGKSCLQNILAYRKDPYGVSGEEFIDGYSPGSSYKYVVGYVVQDDIISGTLTVKETLMFSANVHLSDDISNDERKQRVAKVMQDLELEVCADTKVGTEFLRGVSGGERKRICIGFDASTARNVMECLKQLSAVGLTIIFYIHQPRYSIFKLFDTVLLMDKGKTFDQSPALGLLPHFNIQGYPCDVRDHPADFALDVLIDASR
ncbi:unnamed protein product [Rotaria magnacalcarata]|uniref:ABC transporter domain-containing protein n=5 Tax=Rotaria magnacalcarata TaxID=392030 RepID=A0A8S3AXF9_9BILA|nr:unnamed protein product [Rotaria magnacalcarata]